MPSIRSSIAPREEYVWAIFVCLSYGVVLACFLSVLLRSFGTRIRKRLVLPLIPGDDFDYIWRWCLWGGGRPLSARVSNRLRGCALRGKGTLGPDCLWV